MNYFCYLSDMVYCGVYDNALDNDNYNLAKGFNYHQGPVSHTSPLALLCVGADDCPAYKATMPQALDGGCDDDATQGIFGCTALLRTFECIIILVFNRATTTIISHLQKYLLLLLWLQIVVRCIPIALIVLSKLSKVMINS